MTESLLQGPEGGPGAAGWWLPWLQLVWVGSSKSVGRGVLKEGTVVVARYHAMALSPADCLAPD
jgi:hypothetical protein